MFDFNNAQLPELKPLQTSFVSDEIEADLKQLFIDLFKAHLAVDTFDVNVLGAAQLGSFDLVRKSVNADGLVLLQGDREEAATRYLYRAWKSRNNDGRGMHFLRTYLQMLFPNVAEVEQLWQDKSQPYTQALFANTPRQNFWLYYLSEPNLKLNGAWKIGASRPANELLAESTRIRDTSGSFLTSRIEIALDFGVQVRSISSLINIIRAVIPARLLPIFRFWLRFLLTVNVRASSSLLLQKNADMRHKWCGRVITDHLESSWKLGIDGKPSKLPQPFGSFKLGELLGGKSNWRLKGCRIDSAAVLQKHSEAWAWRVETLPSDPLATYSPAVTPTRLYRHLRKLDGSWALGAYHKLSELNPFKLNGSRSLSSRKMSESARLGEFTLTDYKLPALLPPLPARLTLSGGWKLGGARNPEFTFNLYKVV